MIGRAWIVALLMLAGGSGVSGQITVLAGAGPNLPLGGFDDVASLGGGGGVGVLLELPTTRLEVGAELLYGRSPHAIEGNVSSLYGLRALVRYRVAEVDPVQAFLQGGVGALLHAYSFERFPGLDSSELGLAVSLGAAITVPLRVVTPFLSAAYARGVGHLNTPAFSTELVEVRAGVAVPLGL